MGTLKKKKKLSLISEQDSASICRYFPFAALQLFSPYQQIHLAPPPPCCQPPLLRERLSGGITETLCDLSLDVIGSGGAMIQLELGQLRARGARRAGQAGCVKVLL